MIDHLLNKIFCAEANDFMDDMPDNCIDLVLTSPPYDKLRKYNNLFDFPRLAANIYRITKNGGVVVWVVADQTLKGSESGNSFRQALAFMEVGFKLHDTMIYAKLNHIPQSHNRYEQAFEYMFVFAKNKVNTFNPILELSKTGGKTINLQRKGYGFREGSYRRRNEDITTKEFKVPGNIFYYACGASGKNHPAVFPAKLAYDHIVSWTKPGDVVYDCFSGSGTTCEESAKNGRYFIGNDISQKFVTDSEERLAKIEIFTDLL